MGRRYVQEGGAAKSAMRLLVSAGGSCLDGRLARAGHAGGGVVDDVRAGGGGAARQRGGEAHGARQLARLRTARVAAQAVHVHFAHALKRLCETGLVVQVARNER
jgi:hypothetical protein